MNGFILYVYKKIKLPLFSGIMGCFYAYVMLFYITGYSSSVEISDAYIESEKTKLINILYADEVKAFNEKYSYIDKIIDKEGVFNYKKTKENKENFPIFNKSSTNNLFSVEIPKLGIKEEMFTFNLMFDKNSFNDIQEKKINKDFIDFELLNIGNIDDGFMIGGHSSGYWWADEKLKKIFSSLYILEKGDSVFLYDINGESIEYEIINSSIKKDKEVIDVRGRFYIYTCYPTGTTDSRLVLELIKK